MLGQHIIVLNSAQAASDLLDKRSAIYSDRFCPPMLKDPTLCVHKMNAWRIYLTLIIYVRFDWSRATGMLGYNDTWRHHRRMMSAWLNTRAVVQFRSLQEHQTRLLLRRLLSISKQSHPFEIVKDEFFL